MRERADAKYRDEETGEYTPVFQTYCDGIVAAGCPTFGYDAAAECLDDGLGCHSAAARLNQRLAEERAAPLPYDPLDRDYSMNG